MFNNFKNKNNILAIFFSLIIISLGYFLSNFDFQANFDFQETKSKLSLFAQSAQEQFIPYFFPRYPQRLAYLVSQIEENSEELKFLHEDFRDNLISKCDCSKVQSLCALQNGICKGVGIIDDPCLPEIKEQQAKIKEKVEQIEYFRGLLEKEVKLGFLDQQLQSLRDTGRGDIANEIEQSINNILEKSKEIVSKDFQISPCEPVCEGKKIEACIDVGEKQEQIELKFKLGVTLEDLKIDPIRISEINLGLPEYIELPSFGKLSSFGISLPRKTFKREALIKKEVKFISFEVPKLPSLPQPPTLSLSCPQFPEYSYEDPSEPQLEALKDFELSWFSQIFEFLSQECQKLPDMKDGYGTPTKKSEECFDITKVHLTIAQECSLALNAYQLKELPHPISWLGLDNWRNFWKGYWNQEIKIEKNGKTTTTTPFLYNWGNFWQNNWERFFSQKIPELIKNAPPFSKDVVKESLRENWPYEWKRFFQENWQYLWEEYWQKYWKSYWRNHLEDHLEKWFPQEKEREEKWDEAWKKFWKNFWEDEWKAYWEPFWLNYWKEYESIWNHYFYNNKSFYPIPLPENAFPPESKIPPLPPLPLAPFFPEPGPPSSLAIKIPPHYLDLYEPIVDFLATYDGWPFPPPPLKICEKITSPIKECQELFKNEGEPIPQTCTTNPIDVIDQKCRQLKIEKKKEIPPHACKLLPIFTGQFPTPIGVEYEIEGPQSLIQTQTIGDYPSSLPNCEIAAPSIPTIPLSKYSVKIPDIVLGKFNIPPFLYITLPSFYFEDLIFKDIELCDLDHCKFVFPSLDFRFPVLDLPRIEIEPIALETYEKEGTTYHLPDLEIPPFRLPVYVIGPTFPTPRLGDLMMPELQLPKIQIPKPKFTYSFEGIDISRAITGLLWTFIKNALGISMPNISKCVEAGFPLPLKYTFPQFRFYWPELPKIPEIEFCKDINQFCKNMNDYLSDVINRVEEIEKKFNETTKEIQEKLDKAVDEKIKKKIEDEIKSKLQVYKEKKRKEIIEQIEQGKEIIIVEAESFEIGEIDLDKILEESGVEKKVKIPWPENLKKIPLSKEIKYPKDGFKIPLSKLSYERDFTLKGPGFQLPYADFDLKISDECEGRPARQTVSFIPADFEDHLKSIENINQEITSNSEKLLKWLR